MKKYEYKIVNALLKKYNERKSKHKDTEIHRRIDLPIEKVLKNYSSYNVKIEEKESVNAAIRNLENKGFITSSKLNFSDDYQKLYLVEENISDLEKYAAEKLDITPRSYVADELDGIIKGYKGKGSIVDFYINEVGNTIRNSSAALDSSKIEDILKALAFLEGNNEFLYLREASMLIYGDSKHFEQYRRSQVCSVISKYLCANGEDVFEDENLLERFNVYDTDQDICIKGPVELVISNKKIDISDLTGGVSFSIKDLDRITDISVNCEKVMTVENKTSFLRMKGECCYIYLGGFATKPQIAFIKKLITNNSDKEYLHFGDIDAGGFWIHKKLCEKTCHEFSLYHMNEEDLKNPSYAKCTKELSSNDVNRLMKLRTDGRYSECVEYMLKKNVKLEQEIVSYILCHSSDRERN